MAARPIHRKDRRHFRQGLDHPQRNLRIVNQPFANHIAAIRCVERIKLGKHCIQSGALRFEIALRTHGFAFYRGHDACAPAARHQTRTVNTKRRHHQAQHQTLTDGRELRTQARLGGDFARRLSVVGMNLKMRGQRLQGLLQVGFRGGRHGKLSGYQLSGAPLRRRKPYQAHALRGVAHQRDES